MTTQGISLQGFQGFQSQLPNLLCNLSVGTDGVSHDYWGHITHDKLPFYYSNLVSRGCVPSCNEWLQYAIWNRTHKVTALMDVHHLLEASLLQCVPHTQSMGIFDPQLPASFQLQMASLPAEVVALGSPQQPLHRQGEGPEHCHLVTCLPLRVWGRRRGEGTRCNHFSRMDA